MKIPVSPKTHSIKYKKIETADFDCTQFHISKDILTPNPTTEFIDYTEITPKSGSIEDSNTTVLNIGLGLGKSYSLIKLIEKHLNDPTNIVLLSAPFHSLIKEYHNNILKDTSITKKQILTIDDIDKGVKFDVTTHKVHLLTTHLLLSTGIEKQAFPSAKRLDYLHDILTISKENDRKLVLIIDEIHESIELFNETSIQKLWRFKDIIKKIYCASATFSEVSKVVLKYLAELTDNNILIFENEREQRKNLSDLHLHIVSDTSIKSFDYVIEKLIKSMTSSHIDIITPTKSLAQEIRKNIIEAKLKTSKQINICIGQDRNKKSYDPTLLNIGTTFTTGNNITHPDHELIVILPSSRKVILNNIYSSQGYIKLLQTIGRQRNKGKVHIIFDDALFIDSVKHKAFLKPIEEQIVDTGLIENKYCKYSDVNKEFKLLKDTYNKWCTIFKTATTQHEIITRAVTITTPLDVVHFEKFSFEYGDKYLQDNFFCGSIGTFVLWAALFNQFTTCSLVDINTYEQIYRGLKSPSDIQKCIQISIDKVKTQNSGKVLSDKELVEKTKLALCDTSFYIEDKKLSTTKLNNLIEDCIANSTLNLSKPKLKELIKNNIAKDLQDSKTRKIEMVTGEDQDNSLVKEFEEQEKGKKILLELEKMLLATSEVWDKGLNSLDIIQQKVINEPHISSFINNNLSVIKKYLLGQEPRVNRLDDTQLPKLIIELLLVDKNGFKKDEIGAKKNQVYSRRR
ncbi:DEAD/DEAH box helicase [Sphingobacterium paucimobilis]|uniref:DEAD/DEAH-box helicase domain-containing protein n=1 Tax=Sphingobacterium paucimobilis HER1398 TaxID=1346330 RepID=U2IZK7_9SPHI|nr:DEAD/DEAH box helicase [Sphingobacterium paucimobilis]ERJ58109.1 hypothetical protein M472_04960 [Sphingobacterium paucimobilis HER1398]